MPSIFTKIINREISSEIVFENERIIVIKDINPQAPVHVLIIPKEELVNLNNFNEEQQSLLGELLLTAPLVAEKLGVKETGYRVVINNGDQGGQDVPHLHLHLLGGQQLGGILKN